MPGLVPGIHVAPPPRLCPARTAMPQDVDARNKSGHDGVGAGGAPTMTGESRREAVPAKVYAVAADVPAMRPNTDPEVSPLPPG